jgi:polyisoprenoid-binding protein YceI
MTRARGVFLGWSAIALPASAARAQGVAPDSAVYAIASTSRFEAKTGKAGFLAFAGHDHLIRARAFSGRVIYRPSSPTESRIEIVVQAESLEVLTPPDTAEIRKVTQVMRTEVLHADRYPTIEFVSTGVSAIAGGVRVQGRLTLAGATRDVSAEVQVEVGQDTLRATGRFAVKQTDFGIRPYRGGPGGTVRVADRVAISFEAIGIRVREP